LEASFGSFLDSIQKLCFWKEQEKKNDVLSKEIFDLFLSKKSTIFWKSPKKGRRKGKGRKRVSKKSTIFLTGEDVFEKVRKNEKE
jgi:hypothetical protein